MSAQPAHEMAELPVADPATALPPHAVAHERAPLAIRLVTFLAIIVPLLGVIAAAFFLWGWGFTGPTWACSWACTS